MDILQRIEAKLDASVKMDNLGVALIFAALNGMTSNGEMKKLHVEEMVSLLKDRSEELAKYENL